MSEGCRADRNGQSFSLISQKTNQLVVQDSGTMKAIAALGLAFLPATFITVSRSMLSARTWSDQKQSIWTTNLIQLDPATNWKVYLGAVLGVTATVFMFYWLYMRVFRRFETHRHEEDEDEKTV